MESQKAAVQDPQPAESKTSPGKSALAASEPGNFLVLTAHDYRSPRKANIHFISEQLSERGKVRFFSLRFSRLSKRTQDPRLSLTDKANRVETFKGVDCYLWKTQWHPINTRRPWLRPAEDLLFKLYVAMAGEPLTTWIKEADVVLFESGIAPIFFDRVKKLNPAARTIYIASDDLDTINVADYVKRVFDRVASDMDVIRLPSKSLAKDIKSRDNLFFIPHGINHKLHDQKDESPYGEGIHAVSVGSMLFDPDFFVFASHHFPQVHFHIIGCGQPPHEGYGKNVTVYGEMPHDKTIRYLKHANFGIAPYKSQAVPDYLADTSMKLIQYDFLKLPAVCPQAVVGEYTSRHGYTPGDNDSIAAAINKALNAPHESSRVHFDWDAVTDRTLHPERFSDTSMIGGKP